MSGLPWESAGAYAYPFITRDECLALLQRPPTVLLDIGCGAGGVGYAVAQRWPACERWGCELDAGAAQAARQHFHHVVQQDVETVDFRAIGLARPFDCVTLFDVLEHTVNPWKLMREVRGLLAPDAQVLVSLPNASNIALLLDAMRGHWRYRRRGLLDVTHLRFFADFDARKMFYRSGLRVVRHDVTFLGPGQYIWERHHRETFPLSLSVEELTVRLQSVDDLRRICADQNLYLLTPHHGALRNEEERFLASEEYPPTHAFGFD